MTIKYLTSINNSLYNHQFLQDNMMQSTETISENEDESVLNNLCRMTRESTQDECNLKLIQKVLELNNKIFQLQVESHCLNEKINGLTSQIEFRVQSEKILSLQLDLSQSDAHTYKQNIKVLEQIIESMREQKKVIIKQYQQSQNKLRASIAAKQRDYTTSIQIKQVQTKQRQEEIQDKLEKIKKELKDEKMNNQLLLRKYNQNQQSLQTYLKMYDDLKNMIISKLSQNKEQDPDINFMTQLVTNICIKVQELELEKKKIQQFITIQEGNNQYREERLFQRIKQNIKFYEGRALKKQKNLEDVEIALNDLLKSEDSSNEFSYGQDLIEKLKNKFIDSKAKYQQLRKNIQDLTQNRKIKDDEIRKSNEKLIQLNQQNQRLKKELSKTLQDLEKQKKVGENYKKSYQNLLSQFQENKASQMQNVSRIQQSFKSVSTRKEQEIQNLKQSLIVTQKKLDDSKNQRQVREKLEQRINQLENDLDAEIGRFEQAQNKHRQQIEVSNKNCEVQIKKIREQFQVQKRKINSEYDEYKRKYIELEDNNKCITKMIDENKNNLAMKNLKIQQIQQQLCEFVNQARVQRNQSTKNVQTYKQALLAMNKLLKDNGAKTGSSLFKIPSISQKNQANIQWVKGIIDQYCGCGLKFQSKFIGKIDENFRDFTKILNNQNPLPNLLLIIKTSKGAVFCMFVTKFTTKINDRDPVVLFSGEKKLKYPSEQKKNLDTRPSMITTQGALQFGKKELTITKMLEMKINIIPAGYFGNVDIQSMYGIQTAAEPLNVQKMEIHQIVF